MYINQKVNLLNILIFFSFSFQLSLTYYNDKTNDFQLLITEDDTKENVIVNNTKLFVLTKADKDLILAHSLIVPKKRKSFKNNIFYAISKTYDNLTNLDYKRPEELDIT